MMHWFEERATVQGFTADQIAQASDAVAKLPAYSQNPAKVTPFWEMADKMPDISQIDFGDAGEVSVTLANLLASTKKLNRAKLLAHVKSGGQAMRRNPFTTAPMVAQTSEGLIIVDGHHRLAALMLLGAKTWPVWQVPVKE